MRRRFFNLFAASLLFAACTPLLPQSDLKIVGGERATPADPVVASTVALVGANGAFCSGTLIGPSHVMTAAHCLYYIDTFELKIGFGPDATPAEAVSIVDMFHHGDSNGGLQNDVAVVVISGSLPEGVKPARIAPLSLTEPGLEVILAGYGETGRDRGDYGTLRRVTTKVASFNQTEIILEEGFGRGSCTGDSGGPAYVALDGALHVIGSTSRGTRVSCDNGNGVYMDIRRYQGFLKCAFRSLEAPLDHLLDDDSRSAC